MININWFKMLWLNSHEREVLKKAKLKQVEETDREVDIELTPYKNLIYGNENLTVVFRNGDVISANDVTYEMFLNVKFAKSKETIEEILIRKSLSKVDTEIETEEERKQVTSVLDILRDHPDFTVVGDSVKLKDVDLEMPAPVIASFIELLERIEVEEEHTTCWDDLMNYYNALRMFWLKLAYNPLPQSRNDLLLFVRKNDVQITKTGNIILYRRILSVDGTDEKLIEFISTSYYNAKRDGLDPRKYAIAKNSTKGYYLVNLDDEQELTSSKPDLISNLQQSYLELPLMESNKYTAWQDRSVTIKIGGIYSIPDDKINLDNGICAAGGLHAACVNYDYSGFGNVPVVVLVNPSKAITVPLGETGKLRTTEMFIACVNDKNHGEHYDQNALNLFDEEYHSMSLEELEAAVKSKSLEKLSVKSNAPNVSINDLALIKDMLKTRVQNIY